MRLPLIAPTDLTPEQKPLYEDMRKGIASNFNAFKVEREDGALMGPWNPWLHEPRIGKAVWDLTKAMSIFRALTPEMLEGKCATPGGAALTTWKWLRAMEEHEIHHRGQLSVYLRLNDVPVPSIYGPTADEG